MRRSSPAVRGPRNPAAFRRTIRYAAIGAAAIASVVALLAFGGRSEAPNSGESLDRAAARRIIDLTNAVRREHSLSPLAVSPRLTLAAETYAREMALQDWFDHVGPDGSSVEQRAEAAGYRAWAFLAENLARGAGRPDPDELMDSWLSNPGHRKNLLSSDLSEIGVGCLVLSGAPLRYWCVQEFGTRQR